MKGHNMQQAEHTNIIKMPSRIELLWKRREAAAEELRDLAVRLSRAEGRAGYNVETKGYLRRIVQYERGRLHIEYLSPRFPDVPPPKTARPFAFTISVRFNGAKVLSVAWDDTRTTVLIFKPGDWERYLTAYLASA
jgi:hypothetical protein